MRKIKLLLLITIGIFSSLKEGYGNVLIDSVEISKYLLPSASIDTTYFVNSWYSKDKDEFNLKILFKKSTTDAVTTVKIEEWHQVDNEGNQVGGSLPLIGQGWAFEVGFGKQDSLLFPEIKKGIFDVKFQCYNGNAPVGVAFYGRIFNQQPEFALEISGGKDPGGRCLRIQADTIVPDTFKITLLKHRCNPPETKYVMRLDDGEGDGNLDITMIPSSLVESVRKDTFLVIFKGSTGINRGVGIQVKSEYRKKKSPLPPLYYDQSLQKLLYMYDRPHIEKIFGFDDKTPENLLGCTAAAIDGIRYNPDINYQYMDHYSRPDYSSRYQFEVNYFRKDSMDQSTWELIAKPEEVLEDSVEFKFMESGLYRIRMVAWNTCGRDTLDTSLPLVSIPVEGGGMADTARLIKIYQNDFSQASWNKKQLCLAPETGATGETDTLILVDRGKRLNWEDPSDYKFLINGEEIPAVGGGVLPEDAAYGVPVQLTYKNNVKYTNPASVRGCDSTIWLIPFYKVGNYTVTVKKNTAEPCKEVSDSILIKVSKAPFLGDILKGTDLINKGLIDGMKYCDTFKYVIPKFTDQPLSVLDSNNTQISRYAWKFARASHIDLSDKENPGNTDDIWVFDSLGTTVNYITLKVGNACGWSRQDSISFYTHKTPKINIWRDSVENNDTLCLNFNYKYIFKGDFPDRYSLKLSLQNGREYALTNDSVVRDIIYNTVSGVDGFKEHVKVVNLDAEACVQEFDSAVHILPAPVFETFDTVRFCASNTEIETKYLLKNTPGGYDYLTWNILDPEGGIPIENTNTPEDSDFPNRFFPKIGITQDRTIISYNVSKGKGCFLNDSIVLERVKIPSLTLQNKTGQEFCEGTEIRVISYLQSNVADALDLSVKINGEPFDFTKEDTEVDGKYPYRYKCLTDKDSAVVVFRGANGHDYKGTGGCDAVDSVVLYVSHPEIDIKIQVDTAQATDRIYHFSRLDNADPEKRLIDTNDVSNVVWKWEKILGNGGSTSNAADFQQETVNGGGLFGWLYNCRNMAAGDSIMFTLNGKAKYCGTDVSDTLKIWYPGAKLVGDSAHICENEQGLELWSAKAVQGFFVNLTTLEWSILDGGSGYIDGVSDAAKYIPAKPLPGDIDVKIQVKAKDIWNQPLSKVFKIKIHQLPVFEKSILSSKTNRIVLAKGDELPLNEVGRMKNNGSFRWWRIGTGDRYTISNPTTASAKLTPKYTSGTSTDESIYLEIQPNNSACLSIKDTSYLQISPDPTVKITEKSWEMCYGDIFKINKTAMGIAIKGDTDADTLWSSKRNMGSFQNKGKDKIDYYPNFGKYGKDTIVLEISKQVRNYKGVMKKLSAKDSLEVYVFQKPEKIKFTQNLDSICFNSTEVIVSRITCEPTSYGSRLKYTHDGKLMGNYPIYQWAKNAGKETKLYVYADLGACKKWDKEVRDSVVFTRLEEVRATLDYVDNKVPDICRNETITINTSANSKRFNWSVENGTLLNTNTLKPTYIPPGKGGEDLLVLTVQPILSKCINIDPTVSLPIPIKIDSIPGYNLEDDYMCYNGGSYQVNYDDSGKVGNVEWTTSGSGTFSNRNAATPAYTPSAADIVAGNVTLYAIFKPLAPCQGEEIMRSMQLVIQEAPQVQIDPDLPREVCQGERFLVEFITSPVGIRSWNWTTDKGRLESADTQQPVFYPENNTGIARLTLNVTGECGAAQAPVIFDIVIKSAPELSIDAVSNVCQFVETEIKTTVSAVSYTWDLNDGTISNEQGLKHIYQIVGNKNITLTALYANGCSRSAGKILTVRPKPEAHFIAENTIVGVDKEIHFTNSTEDWEENWTAAWDVNLLKDRGNLKDFNWKFPSEGSYRIDLRVKTNFGCQDTVGMDIEAINYPKAVFNVRLENPDRPCDNSLAIFENLSEGKYLEYAWRLNTDISGIDTTKRLPDGEVRYAASEFRDTTYEITLFVKNNAGIDSVKHTVDIISNITPSIEMTSDLSGCTPLIREFMNRTKGQVDIYEIKWGDGTDTLLRHSDRPVKHRYYNDTDKEIDTEVIIKATNQCWSKSASLPLKLYPNTAIAGLAVDQAEGCYEFNAKFKNVSKGYGNNVTKSLWSWGEIGMPAEENNAVNVNHIFKKPGVYNVTLRVFDKCNEDSHSATITVKGNEKLAFDVENKVYCSDQDIKIQVDPAIRDQFYDYKWNFDSIPGNSDGVWTTNSNLSFVKKFEPKEYIIALKATDVASGCPAYYPVAKKISVNRTPTADIKILSAGGINGCQPFPVRFGYSDLSDGGGIWWDFGGDGISQDKVSINHVFENYGNYQVTLKQQSQEGCWDRDTVTITVKETPDARFELLSPRIFCTDDSTINVEMKNTSDNLLASSYIWRYDGDTLSRKIQPDPKVLKHHRFGVIPLEVIATHLVSQCQASYKDTVISSPNVISRLEIDKPFVCNETEFTFRCASKNGNIATWDLGDGKGIRKDTVFTYVYDRPGLYEVKLKTGNEYGCSDDLSQTLKVYPLPIADFTYVADPRIVNGELGKVDFNNPKNVENGGILFQNYSKVSHYSFVESDTLKSTWQIGDTVTTEKNPYYRFKNNGNYPVVLKVKTAYGCVDSVSDIISIHAIKGLFIPTAFAPATVDPGTARFQPKGIGLQTYQIYVYDAKGTCVWSSDKIEDGRPVEYWDGTFKGTPLPKSTYYWKANAVFIDGSVWEGGEGGKTQGGVILIR